MSQTDQTKMAISYFEAIKHANDSLLELSNSQRHNDKENKAFWDEIFDIANTIGAATNN